MTEFKIVDGFESIDVIVSVNTKNIFRRLFGTTKPSELVTVEEQLTFQDAVKLFRYTSDDKKYLPKFETTDDINLDLRNIMAEKYTPITITKPILEAMLSFLPKINLQGHVTLGMGVFSTLEENGAIVLESDILDLPSIEEKIEIDKDDIMVVLEILHKILMPHVKETGVYTYEEFLNSMYLNTKIKSIFEKGEDGICKIKALVSSNYKEINYDFNFLEEEALDRYFNIKL